ncbi:ribonuclease P protein component [Escherichia coli]|uniref:hypothetical protein n=1 Tax=Escherichia coli TaxID=562 RepID=UPI0010C2E5E5|nr:hypothetical protein [Escherichia coli]GCV22412.1 ribonuclease P protein component [Escherichia coli]
MTTKTVVRSQGITALNLLTFEAFGLRQTEIPALVCVVMAKKVVADCDNRALSEALEKLGRRHCRLARGS